MNCHGCRIKTDMAAAILCEGNLAIFDLARSSFPLQLPDYFDDLAQSRRADRVAAC